MAGRNAKKLEVNEKVKEIKRMQQNWMKQRSHAKDGESDRANSTELGQKTTTGNGKLTMGKPPGQQQSKPSITTFSSGKPGNKAQVSRTEQKSGNRGRVTKTEQPSSFSNQTKNLRSTHVLSQKNATSNPSFQHSQRTNDNVGIDSFTNKKSTNESLYHNNKDFKDKFRHWLKVKNEPIDDGSVLKVKQSDDDRSPGFTENTEFVNKQGDSLSSENTIENLADNIVSRVRNQLYSQGKVDDDVTVPYYKKTEGASSGGDAASVQVTSRSEAASTWSSSSRSQFGEDQYDSHTCPVCRHLMVPPNLPMLLIPCGHTGCKPCLSGRVLCPMCGADVKSQTINLTLHQIILSHQEQIKPKPRADYSASNYTSGHDYEEEYTTLSIRCEALSEELGKSSKHLEELEADLTTERTQCNNIEQEEQRIEREITQLQESLAQLNMHKVEYKRNCHQIESKRSDEVKKVALLKATLQGLRMEMEKVKILYEDGET